MAKTLVSMALLGCCSAAPAWAQAETGSRSSSCGPAPRAKQLAIGTLFGFKQLASRDSMMILGAGAAAAGSVHGVDADVTRDFPSQATFGGSFRAGEVLGSTPFELGGSSAAYSFGRVFDKPSLAIFGAELFQAQLIGETLTFGIKQATRRARPEGSGYSFPSGHATAAFASATVLQRHFGWKAGVPAYAVATYVAASRVEMKRHYLSDVAFGAAVGIAAGRTVPIGGGRQLMITPIAAPGGAGAGFSWIPRQ
jgi:hypothetical protein